MSGLKREVTPLLLSIDWGSDADDGPGGEEGGGADASAASLPCSSTSCYSLSCGFVRSVLCDCFWWVLEADDDGNDDGDGEERP